jgi:chemotaxis protein CheY-P-specific phosphatase CheC
VTSNLDHASLRETVNVGMEQSARALSQVVRTEVHIRNPVLSWRHPSKLLLDVIRRDERIAASAITLLDPVPSKMLLLFPFQSALNLYRLFHGYDVEYEFHFTEDEISFIKETTNILVGSFTTAVCDHLKLERIQFTTPSYYLLTGRSLTSSGSFLRVGEGEDILFAETCLTVRGFSRETPLYMMFKPDCVEAILPILEGLEP